MSTSFERIKNKKKYKLILLGDQSVGKTCLIETYMHNTFDETENPTIGIDFVVTDLNYEGHKYRLQIWDTAGQQRFKSLIPSYLRDASCGIIVYDASKKQSYDNVEQWLSLYRCHVEESAIAVVVANKIDLKYRFPKFGECKMKYNGRNVHHFEVSAKTGQNIHQLFNSIVQLLSQQQYQPILSKRILEGDCQHNIKRISEQSIKLEDSQTIKLSSHRSYCLQQEDSDPTKQFDKNKSKCC